jgi:hypothetical protein
MQFKGIHHHLGAGVLPVGDQFLPDLFGKQFEDAV